MNESPEDNKVRQVGNGHSWSQKHSACCCKTHLHCRLQGACGTCWRLWVYNPLTLFMGASVLLNFRVFIAQTYSKLLGCIYTSALGQIRSMLWKCISWFSPLYVLCSSPRAHWLDFFKWNQIGRCAAEVQSDRHSAHKTRLEWNKNLLKGVWFGPLVLSTIL